MTEPDTEKFPKDTDLDGLALTLAARLRDGAVSVQIEDRGTHWFVTTDWGDDL